MQIIKLKNIQSVVDNTAVIDVVRQAFIAHYLGDLKSLKPTQMLFGVDEQSIAGDCHLKSAYSDQYPYFCIKVASGFAIFREDGAGCLSL